jgi:hypothetical protein
MSAKGVNARWHEYRETAGDVKTSGGSRGVDIDKKLGVMAPLGYWIPQGDGGGLRDTVGVIPHGRKGNRDEV